MSGPGGMTACDPTETFEVELGDRPKLTKGDWTLRPYQPFFSSREYLLNRTEGLTRATFQKQARRRRGHHSYAGYCLANILRRTVDHICGGKSVRRKLS